MGEAVPEFSVQRVQRTHGVAVSVTFTTGGRSGWWVTFGRRQLREAPIFLSEKLYNGVPTELPREYYSILRRKAEKILERRS